MKRRIILLCAVMTVGLFVACVSVLAAACGEDCSGSCTWTNTDGTTGPGTCSLHAYGCNCAHNS